MTTAIGDANRANVDRHQRVDKRKFKHHNPLRRFIKGKSTVLTLHGNGKYWACQKQQTEKKPASKGKYSELQWADRVLTPLSAKNNHQNFIEPCRYSVRG
ncbi:hypothetical protein JK581_002643 [Escherichia coli]|nr:hypothetical protein [Escherichia coli]